MIKRSIGLVEYSLILMLVATFTVVFWNKISESAKYLAGLSMTKVNALPVGNPSSVDDLAALIAKLKAMIDALDKDSPQYNQKRIDATGALGGAIAQYGAIDALIDLIGRLAAKDGNTVDAKACASNMSSCTTLMTVTDFSWSTPSAMTSVYGGGKITVSLTYTYSYVNNDGNIVNSTLNQGAYIQKEQNASSNGQVYGSFLNAYMDKTYPDSSFTGSAASVQKNIDEYLNGKNCELSKSDSQYVSFANHSVVKK